MRQICSCCRVQQGTPIHAQLVGPHAVGHDFTITPFCATHLLLRLSNMLPSSAEVVIDVGKLGDGVRPGSYSTDSTSMGTM